ncbi:MAG: hypothetical protein M1833_003387 [Piccolia ochrophora]|nr:MAG: hypothetical protein M1833_003387 [Piccolia ochrophora]
MDAPDDRDIKLQRSSADLIADFSRSLSRFISVSEPESHSPSSRVQYRATVQEREANRLARLLEPFQEWPQLLDPHLTAIVSLLVTALSDQCVQVLNNPPAEITPEEVSRTKAGSVPLHRAICRLLYTFCKIRGESVISRFLDNEAKLLEPILAAFQAWDTREPQTSVGLMTWEERYVLLLWLSHLLLTPFDLASVSGRIFTSGGNDDSLKQLSPPPNLPNVTLELISVGLKYVSAASKERQSAKSMLVRLCIRPDMHSLGLMNSLIDWALDVFSSKSELSFVSAYQHVGVLSFLQGILTSARLQDISPYVTRIYRLVHAINTEDTSYFVQIRSSALTRKLLIKIFRALTNVILTPQHESVSGTSEDLASEVLEDAIDFFLRALADRDTPVRYAASKALSMITLKLDPSMAAEVVEAVVSSLAEDVLWEEISTGRQLMMSETASVERSTLRRNLNAVNALRWHGLTLTLAHLLFRRSPPPDQLPQILNALILSLTFEHRSSGGGSLGNNVRDAACFGIWALSRKYTTAELLAVDSTAIQAALQYHVFLSVQQLLAVELVSTATLDPVGNIRRGASAALQELVGRHPDTVACGISLVQVVDYHSVALRSKAITEVATSAATLDEVYWTSLVENTLGWRGVGSPDASSRRVASDGIGTLSTLVGPACTSQYRLIHMIDRCVEALQNLQSRSVELRHGLLLSLAAILRADMSPTVIGHAEPANGVSSKETRSTLDLTMSAIYKVSQGLELLSEKDLTSNDLRPELTAEAACTAITSIALRLDALLSTTTQGQHILKSDRVRKVIRRCSNVLSLCLSRAEDAVLSALCDAAKALFQITPQLERASLIRMLVSRAHSDSSGKLASNNRQIGSTKVLGAVFAFLGPSSNGHLLEEQQLVVDILVSNASPNADIESRAASIRSLATGPISSEILTSEMVSVLEKCLDDYTIDARGDIGSLVRLEAIQAIATAGEHGLLSRVVLEERLLRKVARLSAEKLDKVRANSWTCLYKTWTLLRPSLVDTFASNNQTSSIEYFFQLLELLRRHDVAWIRDSIVEGYVTSAGVGSESVLRASRTALANFAYRLSPTRQSDDFGLPDLCDSLLLALRPSEKAERLSIPTLETLAFLFDAGILQLLEDDDSDGFHKYDFQSVLIAVRETHYKSRSIPKLTASIHVYSGLAQLPSVRSAAVAKLISLLLHPYPRVRTVAAESLYTLQPPAPSPTTSLPERILLPLRKADWSAPVAELRESVKGIKAGLA